MKKKKISKCMSPKVKLKGKKRAKDWEKILLNH